MMLSQLIGMTILFADSVFSEIVATSVCSTYATVCLNGGTCEVTGTGWRCVCPSTHNGEFCEYEFGPCNCYYGGVCSGSVCSCVNTAILPSPQDEFCDIASSLHSDDTQLAYGLSYFICENGGTRSSETSTTKYDPAVACDCVYGYGGFRCEQACTTGSTISHCEDYTTTTTPTTTTTSTTVEDTTTTTTEAPTTTTSDAGVTTTTDAAATTTSDSSATTTTVDPAATTTTDPAATTTAVDLAATTTSAATTTTSETTTSATAIPTTTTPGMTMEESEAILFPDIPEEEASTIVRDIQADPSVSIDMIPFLIGGYSGGLRTSMSYLISESLAWAAYEDKQLEIDRDFHTFNDKTLGNCYSFNSAQGSTVYKRRKMGQAEGLTVYLRVETNSYASWTVPSGYFVFVHGRNEPVVSDSPRSSVEAGTVATLKVKLTQFERLNGRYGNCIEAKETLNNYYYDGEYTTAGCLRSFYQDYALSNCGCMDPRYPQDPERPTCGLSKRQCLIDITEKRGDSSMWDECDCPMPCSQSQFDIEYSKAPLRPQMSRLNNSDVVLINVIFPLSQATILVEYPAMEITQFFSQLGGLIGILMGMCVISVFEVIFCIVDVTMILFEFK